jgi:hypothetical protein
MFNTFIHASKITCITTIFCYYLAAQDYNTLYYKTERFSAEAHALMNDNGNNNIYHVYLDNVFVFLPEVKIKKKKVIAIDKTFGRKILKTMHKKILSKAATEYEDNPSRFFSLFKENTPYNYVILENSLVFAETTKEDNNYYKNKFSKHYFISGLKGRVYYAGQMRIYKRPQRTTIVLNNNSGTYRPHDIFLPNVLHLLRDNFGNDESLVFLARPYNKIFTESYSESENISTESH